MKYPHIIQGGMGVAVSSWPLARAVSLRGQLGVVSGTGIDTVFARRLQLGDIGGHMAEAITQFPIPEIAKKVWDRYFVPGGKAPNAPFKSKPIPTVRPSRALNDLIVVANFVEVHLAKKGHDGLVGINLLEKIQLPTLPSLLGAMLARVDFVIMGAGIPRAIPGVLDLLSEGKAAELRLSTIEASACTSMCGHDDDGAQIEFDPSHYMPPEGVLKRPKFLAVVSSSLLAQVLARKCSPPADGFIIEAPTAGGHNAPPRGDLGLDASGQPLYGPKDEVDLAKVKELGLPFWLAGSWGAAGKLVEAIEAGATGIQVGTAFAFCEESGIAEPIRRRVVAKSLNGQAHVFTDPKASPTGFPFKVLEDSETVSNPDVYESRERICDLGYLRQAYRMENGKIGYRCPAEPIEDYVAKGGDPADCLNRKCVCNGLMATAGFPQVRHGVEEPSLITAGDEVAHLSRFVKPGADRYTADEVLDLLLG